MASSGMWNSTETYKQAAERMHRELKEIASRIGDDSRTITDLKRNLEVPIPMILTCPWCKERHIDEGEFADRAHHTHACQKCGMVWRPAIRSTVGVQFLPGFKNKESHGNDQGNSPAT